MLADKFNQLQMGLVAADRVFQVFDTRATISDYGKLAPAELRGHIAFDNVVPYWKILHYDLKLWIEQQSSRRLR